MNYEQQKAKAQFCAEFGQKVQDTVQDIALVCMKTDASTFRDLQLTCTAADNKLWGLLVFCGTGLYFFVHPYESLMTAMVRQTAHGAPPTEQILALHTRPELRCTLQKPAWYSRLFGNARTAIVLSYKDSGGKNRFLTLEPHGNVRDVLDKLAAWLATLP